jgi:hypothetical protein
MKTIAVFSNQHEFDYMVRENKDVKHVKIDSIDNVLSMKFDSVYVSSRMSWLTNPDAQAAYDSIRQRQPELFENKVKDKVFDIKGVSRTCIKCGKDYIDTVFPNLASTTVINTPAFTCPQCENPLSFENINSFAYDLIAGVVEAKSLDVAAQKEQIIKERLTSMGVDIEQEIKNGAPNMTRSTSNRKESYYYRDRLIVTFFEAKTFTQTDPMRIVTEVYYY